MSQHVVRGRRRVVGEGGEVTAPSWSLRALNDGVGGGGGEAFTVKKREVTLLAHDAPAIAEPSGYERIFRFSMARPRGVLRGVPAWLVGWSKQTNSLGCTPGPNGPSGLANKRHSRKCSVRLRCACTHL